jgi:hypothetical protein
MVVVQLFGGGTRHNYKEMIFGLPHLNTPFHSMANVVEGLESPPTGN